MPAVAATVPGHRRVHQLIRSRPSWLPGLAVALALTGAWQSADALGKIDFETIAAPTEIGAAWWRLTMDGPLLELTRHTLTMFAVSWFLAVGLGAALGIAIGLSAWAARLTRSTVTFLRFVPPPALIPLVIMIFGLSSRGEMTIATFAAVWPVILNATAGVEQVDVRLVDVGRTLQLGRFARLRKLVLPAALPMIFAGARIASAICLIVVVATEMIGVPEGIGQEIVRSAAALRPDEAYAYIVWAGVLGVMINLTLVRLERRVLAWQPTWREA